MAFAGFKTDSFVCKAIHGIRSILMCNPFQMPSRTGYGRRGSFCLTVYKLTHHNVTEENLDYKLPLLEKALTAYIPVSSRRTRTAILNDGPLQRILGMKLMEHLGH